MVEELLEFFAAHARDLEWRRNPTPYRVWVSEIMLQQTRVEAVKSYYARFMAEVPDVETLAKLPEDRLFKLWEGLGYYSRARNLQKAAVRIVEAGRFPDTPAAIAELPGVGPYTAGAISSIAFGLPEPAVDGNVLRVLSRVKGRNYDRDAAAAELRPLYPAGRCSDFTQALMELGATVCLPNGEPRCGDCPLAAECAALREGRIAELPVREVKPPRRIERKNVLLLECDGLFAVEKRPGKGLLARLWAFPDTGKETDVERFLTEGGWRSEIIQELPESRHVFTHVEWLMRNFRVNVKRPLPENPYRWATAEAIRSECAVPSAYGKLAAYLPGGEKSAGGGRERNL